MMMMKIQKEWSSSSSSGMADQELVFGERLLFIHDGVAEGNEW